MTGRAARLRAFGGAAGGRGGAGAAALGPRCSRESTGEARAGARCGAARRSPTPASCRAPRAACSARWRATAWAAWSSSRAPTEVTSRYPDGPRELEDGGFWDILAGQPTDDSEMALALARSIVAEGRFDRDAALARLPGVAALRALRHRRHRARGARRPPRPAQPGQRLAHAREPARHLRPRPRAPRRPSSRHRTAASPTRTPPAWIRSRPS